MRSKISSAAVQPAHESGRGDAHEAPRTAIEQERRDRVAWRADRRRRHRESRRGAEQNAPMKVAVPVASATGRKVRTLTSGIISSIANITPPIGVLKVAAMPAPAPAATRVMRCHGAMLQHLAQGRAERGADLDDRAFAPDRGAAADRESRGERFHRRDHRPDHALLVIDRVHHLGHAVAARLGCEIRDEEGDDHAADAPARG